MQQQGSAPIGADVNCISIRLLPCHLRYEGFKQCILSQGASNQRFWLVRTVDLQYSVLRPTFTSCGVLHPKGGNAIMFSQITAAQLKICIFHTHEAIRWKYFDVEILAWIVSLVSEPDSPVPRLSLLRYLSQACLDYCP